MITTNHINDLYTQFATAPALFENRDINILMDYAFDTDLFDFDGDSIVINGIAEGSPLRKVELEKIYGVRDFDKFLAVVLANSIYFVNKTDGSVSIHLKDLDGAEAA